MKYFAAISLLSLGVTSAAVQTKNAPEDQNARGLQRLRIPVSRDSNVVSNSIRMTRAPTTPAPTECPYYAINHDLAQTTTELNVTVDMDDAISKEFAEGHFRLKITEGPLVPAGKDFVEIQAWCIDYDRPIGPGEYDMDVISAFDSEGLREGAIDKPWTLPSLAWLINNVQVGDEWNDDAGCQGTIGWKEYQAAVWYIVDNKQGKDNDFYNPRIECISKQMSDKALEVGKAYYPDCSNAEEQIPMIFIVDEPDGTITNQVLLAEVKLSSVEGMCECRQEPEDKSWVPPEEPKDDTMTTSSPPGTKGDPHFKTHSGEMYDFHGGCDLVLVDNPAFKDRLGMLIHIRTKIETWWSYVESAVVRIGDETVEITGSSKSEWLYLNGVANEPLEEMKWYHAKVGGLILRYRHDGSNGEAHLYMGGTSEKIVLRTFNEFVKVEAEEHGNGHFLNSHGLLGRYPDGKRVRRDKETFIEDANAFGQEWQVQPDEPKLFHTYEGEWVVPAGQKCALPTETSAKKMLRQRRLANGVPMEVAEEACSHLMGDEKKGCVYDIIATQNVGMAAVW